MALPKGHRMSDYKPVRPQAQKTHGSEATETDGTTATPSPWPGRRKEFGGLLRLPCCVLDLDGEGGWQWLTY